MKAILEAWINEHPKVSEWVNRKRSNATRFDYAERLHNFCEEMKMNPETLAEMDDIKAQDMLEQYFATREREEKPTNTTMSTITAIRAFWSRTHGNKKLAFERGTFAPPQIGTHSYDFQRTDLKNIFAIANTTEKAIISSAVSLGWEISSFLDLDRDKIKTLIAQAKANKEETVFFEDIRHKRKEHRLGIINPLAIEWLSKYLESAEPNEKLFSYSEQGLNKIVKRLVKEAHIETGKLRVHFHRLRAWHESALFGAGFNAQQVDFIQGHALGAVRATYYKELRQQIEEKYPTVYHEKLDISNGNGTVIKAKVGELELRALQAEEENAKLKARIAELETEKSTSDNVLKILAKRMSMSKGVTESEDDIALQKFIQGK
jgi:integrase